ncbi:MAG: hypothetical protein JXA94_02270 [Parachlamydiales bacterium]|nr:hypothetical protein [Parachlamydiales bacterium]
MAAVQGDAYLWDTANLDHFDCAGSSSGEWLSQVDAQLKEFQGFLEDFDSKFSFLQRKVEVISRESSIEPTCESSYRYLSERSLDQLLQDVKALGDIHKKGEKLQINTRSKLLEKSSFAGPFSGWMRAVSSAALLSDTSSENVTEYLNEVFNNTIKFFKSDSVKKPKETRENLLAFQKNKDLFEKAYLGYKILFDTYLDEAQRAEIGSEEKNRKVKICNEFQKIGRKIKVLLLMSKMLQEKGVDAFMYKPAKEGRLTDDSHLDVFNNFIYINDQAKEQFYNENKDKINLLKVIASY